VRVSSSTSGMAIRPKSPTSHFPSSSYRFPGLMSLCPMLWAAASRARVLAISASAATTVSRGAPATALAIGVAIGIASQGRSFFDGLSGR
jgi:hypothetical protein